MTKERKLAIEMWTNIRGMLSASDGRLPEDLVSYKDMFCREHSLKWENSCWFCQYIDYCNKCPLTSCGTDSYYDNVRDCMFDTNDRIEACIITS
jgi:hypothetical protein